MTVRNAECFFNERNGEGSQLVQVFNRLPRLTNYKLNACKQFLSSCPPCRFASSSASHNPFHLMAVRSMSNRNENEQDGLLAVSPTGEILNTSSFDLCIHAVIQFDKPVVVSDAKKFIHEILLSRSPRFSCIVTKNEKGVLQWEKTAVNVDDHVFVPHFPPDLPAYDKYVEEYISDMHMRKLSPSRPLWEFHFINYKTSKGEATVILNLHHMLGDGVSLMSLALACCTRADDPTLTPTIPVSSHCQQPEQIHEKLHNTSGWAGFKFMWHLLFSAVVVMWYTLHDLISSFIRFKWIEDSRVPFRGHPGVELLPKDMASTTFTLEDIRKIKSRVGGSVNDVIMGVVFYGFRRYCEMVLPDPKQVENLRITALALINTRSDPGIKPLEEMTKSKTRAPWGNRFAFLQLPVPMKKLGNPLEYVTKAKSMLDKKKMSLAAFLFNTVIRYVTRFSGSKTSAKVMYDTLANATFTVTNMQGATEELSMAGYTVKGGFFSVSGAPQSILVTCLSYKDKCGLQVMTTKGYVDANEFSKCLEEAFMEMKDASE